MAEAEAVERRSRRGGGRDARRQARSGGSRGASAPFITRNILRLISSPMRRQS